MKIVIPIFSFGKAGGARVLSQLANHWISDGHDVTFLTHKSSDIPYYPTTAKILYFDNNGRLSLESNINYKVPITKVFGIRRLMKKALEKIECDVILANHSLTASPVVNTKNPAKKFYYVQAYEPDFFEPLTLKNKILQDISKKSYKLGLNIIVNAEMYFSYKEITADKFVPPGLDLNIFRPIERPNNNKVIIGTIGRVEKHKGTGYIVEAFKNLVNTSNVNCELHVAFGTKDLENIQGVKISNPDGDKNLAAFYRSIDVYVCAQTIQLDAIHYPIIESMACKTPVITTGYYPSSEKNAQIIPIEDEKAIEDSIIKFLNSTDLDIEKKVNEGYIDIQQFDWVTVSRKMLSYFKS